MFRQQQIQDELQVDLESQIILRLPERVANLLRECLKPDGPNLKDRLSLELENGSRHRTLYFDDMILHAKLVDLPCIIESFKTIDKKTTYKSADICQMLVCTEEKEQEKEVDPKLQKKKDGIFKVEKKYLWQHGITPPLKNVRKMRFRKTMKKKGEDKDFGDKWEQINEERTSRTTLEGPLEESESIHPPYQHLDPSILHHSPAHHHHHHLLHHLPDEGSQDSQDIHEGSITSPRSTGSAASPCAERSQQPSSFLFVGPLGKKRKYSRQRATSDDNESETHPLSTAAGSPETLEEMDQSQSPSPGESVQSEMVGSGSRKNSTVQEQSSSPSPGEFAPNVVTTQISASALQSISSESSTESTGEGGGPPMGGSITSKPSPIIGAPTSVIRRTYRKKQEHPLNLSVSLPPSSSNFSSPSTIIPGGGRLQPSGGDGHGPTNPSVIRDELYFEGRTGGDQRQVFVWRYRDEVAASSPISAGPMSPSTSAISATNFAVPEASGSKLGSSGSSTSSVSQIPPGCHDEMGEDKVGGSSSTGGGGGAKGPKKKLRCGDCGKEFSQLRNYRYHRSRHEGSDQFSCTCPVCGKQFNDRGYLSSHMKIHRNAKEYRCEYCTKGFNQRVAYNMHRRIHTGHRPHQCEVCGKSFSRRMLLKQHMRIHTGERPYSCGVCNKAFADRSNMLLHQRLHSGERPYVCEICKKSFSKNHHLKTHMNHHAGIKPYECPKCHARFSQSSNMKTHLKKCSGVPNPTSSQRQQMLRRNPLDIGRSTAHLPPLQSVVAAAGSRDTLPTLPGTSRLLYDQQSLNLLSQSLGCNQPVVPQLSPGHSRGGQVPIESLLLHLNVSRSRHPSQSSMHHGQQPPSPTTTTMSFPDLQLMLRNAVSVSRPVSGSSNSGQQQQQRLYSTPSPPSSSTVSASSVSSGMIVSSGMGGGATSVNIRRSPAEGSMSSGNEPISPPSMSPMMVLNPTLGLVSYGMGSGLRGSGGHIDSSVMPPPPTNGTVLRNVPQPSNSSLIPPELFPPVNSMLKIDTRSMEGFPSTLLSPPDKSGRQGRGQPSPMISPSRKQASPSSLSASGSYIPLSTLESAAIASGLRSPSQVARFLTNAIRDAEAPFQATNPGSYSSSRLPSISQHNVLEVMAAAAAAEQNLSSGSSSSSASLSSTRMRQVHSPHHQNLQQPSHSQFQFSGDSRPLPSFHMGHGSSSGSHLHHHHHHSSSSPQHMSGTAQSPPPPFSVITSSHLLQQHQQDPHTNMQQSSLPPSVRYSSTTSSSPSSASRLSTVDEQQLELQQSRQYGYHQNLLLSHISQGTVTPGYSNTTNASPSSGYSTFTHSIIRSRSQSPASQQPRERNQDYPN